MIPYGRQSIIEADIEAVVEVLRSDFLTQGPAVPRFEQAVADYCGAGFGIAVNSGTAALHIACLALGVGPGDWVWTSPISFNHRNDDFSVNALGQKGHPVAEGFEYNSKNNDHFLSIDEMRAMNRQVLA